MPNLSYAEHLRGCARQCETITELLAAGHRFALLAHSGQHVNVEGERMCAAYAEICEWRLSRLGTWPGV